MNPDIKSTHDRYTEFTGSDEMREQYEARLKAQRDKSFSLYIAAEDGEAKGLIKGILKIAEHKFELSDENRILIEKCLDLVILNKALEEIFTIEIQDDLMALFKNQ